MENMIQKADELEVKAALILSDNLFKQYERGITSNQQNEQAGSFIKDVRAKIKILDDKRLDLTRPLTAAKKKIDDFFNGPIDKLKAVDKVIAKAMGDFFQEQEAIRQKEEAAIRAKAEAEAKKLEERAEKAAAAGNDDKADDLRQKAQDAISTVPVVESKVEKVAGLAMREYWHFQVVDEAKVPLEFLCVDEKKLQKYADAMKNMAKIEGVKFWVEKLPVRTR